MEQAPIYSSVGGLPPAYPTIRESWVALGWHFLPSGLLLLVKSAGQLPVPVVGWVVVLFGFSVTTRVLLMLWLRRRAGPARWQALHWPRPHRPWVVVGLLLPTTLALAVVLSPQRFLHLPHWSVDSWLAVLVAHPSLALVFGCLVGPAAEELVFRGILLRGLLRNYRPAVAIAQSALLFGLAHINPAQALNAFLIGLLLGWLYYRSRSLWLCIGLHSFYNALVFGSAKLSGLSGRPHSLPIGSLPIYGLLWVAAGVVLAACLLALVRSQASQVPNAKAPGGRPALLLTSEDDSVTSGGAA